MKISKINNAVGILGGIKITKLPDKKVKNDLLNNYLHLRGFIRDAEEESTDLSKKFREDWSEEMDAVESLAMRKEPIVGHDEYLEAKRDTEKTLREIMEREVETAVKAIPMDDFMNACKGEELTLEQVAFLKEVGILE